MLQANQSTYPYLIIKSQQFVTIFLSTQRNRSHLILPKENNLASKKALKHSELVVLGHS